MKEELGKRWFLAGSYTNEQERMGLYLLSMEEGFLKLESSFWGGENPSFFCLDRQRQKIYVACESEKESRIFVYDRNDREPRTSLEGSGTGLCHLTLDEKTNKLYGSCYGSGDFFRIDLETGACDAVYRGGKNGHAHGMAISPSGRCLLGADLGENRVILFSRDLQELSALYFEEDLGPRQIVFPPGRVRRSGQVYVIHEKGCMISRLAFEEGQGRLEEQRRLALQRRSESSVQFPGTAAWEKDGVHLLVPIRGTDRIERIQTDALSSAGSFSSGGEWPRMVSVGSKGEILTANQISGKLCCFTIDCGEYRLRFEIGIPGVSCVEEISW